MGPSRAVYAVKLGEKASFCPVAGPSNDQRLFSEHHKISHIQLKRSRSPSFHLCFRSFLAFSERHPFQRFLIGLPNIAVSILEATWRGLHASLAGNVFSTQKRLADETTYKNSENMPISLNQFLIPFLNHWINLWMLVQVFRSQLGLICVRQIEVWPCLSVKDIDEQC